MPKNDLIKSSIPYVANLVNLNDINHSNSFSLSLKRLCQSHQCSPLEYVAKSVKSIQQQYYSKHGRTKWISAEWIAALTNNTIVGVPQSQDTTYLDVPYMGMTYWENGSRIIKVPDDIHKSEYRASVAHEMVHQIINDATGSDPKYSQSNYDEELLCEHGAGLLLLPSYITRNIEEYLEKDNRESALMIRNLAKSQHLPIKLVCQRLFDPSLCNENSIQAICMWDVTRIVDITNSTKLTWSVSKDAFLPNGNKARQGGVILKAIGDAVDSGKEFSYGFSEEKVKIGTMSGNFLISYCIYPFIRGSHRRLRLLSVFFKTDPAAQATLK